MGRYRKIDPRIWNDAKFAALSHEAQRIFLFILTHPQMTGLGAFRATTNGMAEELGLDGKGFREPFRELLAKGLVKYDERAFLIFAPNFLRYNEPENPNVIKGWLGALEYLPESALLIEVVDRASEAAEKFSNNNNALETKRVLDTLSERLSKEFGKPFRKGSPNQITVTEADNSKQEITQLSNESCVRATYEFDPIKAQSADEDESEQTKSTRRKSAVDFYDLPEGLIGEWKTQRGALKAPITQVVVDSFKKEAERAGITLADAVRCSIAAGWRGFKAGWYMNREADGRDGKPAQSRAEQETEEKFRNYCRLILDSHRYGSQVEKAVFVTDPDRYLTQARGWLNDYKNGDKPPF